MHGRHAQAPGDNDAALAKLAAELAAAVEVFASVPPDRVDADAHPKADAYRALEAAAVQWLDAGPAPDQVAITLKAVQAVLTSDDWDGFERATSGPCRRPRPSSMRQPASPD